MNGYIKINRSFRQLDLYRKASCQQREVFWALIERVNYEPKFIDFGGKRRILDVGQIWLSRKGIIKELIHTKVTDSHVRYAIKKLVNGGFIELVVSARNGGSIFQCNSRFYEEIAQPFDIRKLTNEQPTNNQRTTNEQPTNNQPKGLIVNYLQEVATNEQPTNNQRTTNEQPTNNPNLKKKEKRINLHNHNQFENFNFNEKSSVKKPEVIIEKEKKVAAKKENADDFVFPAVEEVDVLLNYFTNKETIAFFAAKYPLLSIETEFEGIYAALQKKAANGNAQLGNPYSYVLKCLENAEQRRQQRVSAQKTTKLNGRRKSTAKAEVSDWSSTTDFWA